MNSQKDDYPLPLRILSAVDLHNINEEVTNRPSMIRDNQVLKATVKRPYIILFGLYAIWKEDEVRDFVLTIAKGNLEIEAVTEWLSDKVEEIPNDKQ